jgi:hypothetical protein
MSFIEWYALFCLTTATMATIDLLMPVIAMENSAVGKIESKGITYIVFFTISIVLAPLLFFSCIIPSWNERFKISLHKGMYPKE